MSLTPDPAAWLADPEVFAVNRLPAHAALSFTMPEYPAEVSLCGEWAFRCAMRPGADFSPWGSITVPGFIQLQGGPEHPYGTPHYVNTEYPWDGHEKLRPGQIPQRYNPVGEYQRSFTLPGGWHNCFIRLEGADSAAAVWCNGQFIGYSEDSFTPAEFDLTSAVRPGENELIIRVYRFCSGSWLEDQDFWRMSGLFRPVVLFTKPAFHLEDVFVRQSFADDFSSADVRFVCRCSGAGSLCVEFNAESRTLAFDGSVQELAAEFTVQSPKLWSAESPALYKAAFTLRGEGGETAETTQLEVGLRKFELKNRQMLLNGMRIVFKGVNRHEWSCRTGRAVSREEMEQDVEILKAYNVNAVRTSHYPNDPYFLTLCDRYGLYVIGETNLETHGTWQKLGLDGSDENTLPGDKPEWRQSVLARAEAMLQRDKNHPAILLWSCGNESYGGKTIFEMSEYFRRTDPERLVHYEGISWDRRYPATSDVESQMYTPVAGIRVFLAEHPEKPFIMCEYSHAMGASCGGLDLYTEYAYEEPLYQGGFIWEYIDHGLAAVGPDGRQYFAYGGDFGDRPTDREFCIDGLVLPDRRPTAKLAAVKAAYADFRVTLAQNGGECTAHIKNRSLFTDLSAYRLVLTAALDGEPVQTTELACALAPGEECTLALPFGLPQGAGLAVLTLALLRRESVPGQKAGYEAAFGQLWANTPAMSAQPTSCPELICSDYNIGVRGDGFHYIFGRGKGLVSMRFAGRELLDDTVRPNFWRAPTNNDAGAGQPARFAFWKTAGPYAKCDNLAAECKAGRAIVRAGYTLPDGQAVTVHFAIDGAGRCTVQMEWDGAEAEAPEFGLLFPFRPELRAAEYCGLGPGEAAADRLFGTRMGRWAYDVREDIAQSSPVYPQECGARYSVYAAALTGPAGRGVAFSCPADNGMVFSALPYTPHEVENARHLYELPRDDIHTIVRCSAFQRGVGGDDSWGALPKPDVCFALHTGDSFTFAISPL